MIARVRCGDGDVVISTAPRCVASMRSDGRSTWGRILGCPVHAATSSWHRLSRTTVRCEQPHRGLPRDAPSAVGGRQSIKWPGEESNLACGRGESLGPPHPVRVVAECLPALFSDIAALSLIVRQPAPRQQGRLPIDRGTKGPRNQDRRPRYRPAPPSERLEEPPPMQCQLPRAMDPPTRSRLTHSRKLKAFRCFLRRAAGHRVAQAVGIWRLTT